MALHTLRPLFGIQPLFLALLLLFASVVKGCFPLMSPAGGCGSGCCMPAGCGDGGGAVPMAPPFAPDYVYPSYPSYPVYPAQPAVPYAAKSRSMAMAPSTAAHTAASASADASCAKRYADTRLSCALPFERRTPSDESECRRHCSNAMPRCRSFQFDSAGSVCDLFEHSLSPSFNSRGHDDSGVPLDHQSRTMPSVGTNPLPGMALSPTSAASSSSCVPTLESLAGSVFVGFACDAPSPPSSDPFLLTDDDQSEETAAAEATADEKQLPAPLPPPPPPPTPPSRKASPAGESLEPFLSSTGPPSAHKPNGRRVDHFSSSRGERVGQQQQKGEEDTVPPAVGADEADRHSADCPVDGTRARVQLIDGVALTGQSPIGSVQLDSADVCLHICRQNAFLDGRRLPSPCRSATFHRQNGRCEFLSGSISPNGALQYVPNPDSLYFEKICIPRNELAPGCDDVIHRIPQHHLDPRRTTDGGTVQTANSQLECVRKCIGAKVQLGFNCVSASFFFDWPSQNCYLSRFTRLSRPEMYVAERRELVDYMEMPPCFQLPSRVRLHDVPTAAPFPFGWGPCIGGMRWRKKNCTRDGAEESDGEEEKCVEREFCGKSEAGTGEGCGETGQCGDGDAVQRAAIPSAEEVAKPVAPNFEVAKRFNGPSAASEEASLFSEQDDANQKEVRFFGPPHRADGPSEENAHIAKTVTAQCDETEKCCPIGAAEGMVRGCSLGRRTLADGRTTVSCVPDECQ